MFEKILHAIIIVLVIAVIIGLGGLIAQSATDHQMVVLKTRYHDCMDLTKGDQNLCVKRSGIAD